MKVKLLINLDFKAIEICEENGIRLENGLIKPHIDENKNVFSS